jgi:hypothetical protein
MKTNFIVFFVCLLAFTASGQQKLPVIDDQTGEPANYSVSSLNSKIPVFIQTDRHTKSISPFNNITNDPLGSVVYLEGASEISLTTRLRKDSLSYYRYTILENDTTTLVSNALLTKVNLVWNNRSSWPGYLTMDFGIKNIVNRKLTVQVYRLPDASQVTTVIIYNKALKPAEIAEKLLIKQGRYDKRIKLFRNEIIDLKTKPQFTIDKNNKGLYVSMAKTDLDFAYFIYLIYKNKDEKIPTIHSNNWSYGNLGGRPGYFIDADYFQKSGEYEVIISPESNYPNVLNNANRAAARFSFSVLAPPKTYTAKQVLITILAGFSLITVVAACIIYLVKRKSRNKLMLANLQTEIFKSELNTVRAQLNPHFVFNALSGIQNLMNKNETERANEYLFKFARLTRNVLDNHALMSIKEEAELLRDYLDMEQLRFPFRYDIQVDDSLNFGDVEIPAMLLQPFVENAVKHGMASSKTDGTISIQILQNVKDLIFMIEDNGPGFDVVRETDGLGLKLSKKRVALLNKTYTECPILLSIASGPGKTTVKITLTQWL